MSRPVRWTLATAVVIALVLGASGRWTDALLWTYVAIGSGIALLATVLVPNDTVRARLSKGPRGIDPISPPVFRALGVGHIAVGALDVGRWHLTDGIPVAIRIAGLALFALGFAVNVWALAVNRFFIPAVRIQAERGHHLVTAGPYGWIRHPGYAGLLLGVVASAVALGSWLAVALALVMAGFILRRAALEDRFVRTELPGYGDYATRVRFRLMPWVW